MTSAQVNSNRFKNLTPQICVTPNFGSERDFHSPLMAQLFMDDVEKKQKGNGDEFDQRNLTNRFASSHGNKDSRFISGSDTISFQAINGSQKTMKTRDSKDLTNLLDSLHTPNFQAPTHSIMKAPFPVVHQSTQHRHELLIPNDLIGCVIGRGGNKINEIRQISQANIKISSGEEGILDRRIVITGSFPAVQCAQSLINNSIELHKHLLALNMAMNSVFSGGQNLQSKMNKQVDQYQQTTNCDQNGANHSLKSHGSMEMSQLENIQVLKNIPIPNRDQNAFQQHLMHMHRTPTFPTHVRKEAQSAPAKLEATTKLGVVECQYSPKTWYKRNSECKTARAGRIGSFCQTPYMIAPVMSATQLKEKIQAVSTDFDTETLSPQKVLSLIEQLPKEEQQKWCHLFGL